jgi:hypothetical protein
MKTLLFLFIPFLLLTRQAAHVVPKDYVEIEYVGYHLYKSLIIYTEKSDLDAIRQGLTHRYDSMKQITPVERPLTPEEKMTEVNRSFDFVIARKETNEKIINFFQSRDHLFMPSLKYKGYKITVGGKIYCISYKTESKFFEDFKKYLTIENCDQQVIEKIDVISQACAKD